MPHIEVSARINLDADTLWHEVGSFQAVGRWHPMLAKVEGSGEQPGALRTAHTPDGQKQVEQLQELDSAHHFYRYVMLSSPLPISGYISEFRVEDNDEHTSTVLWTSDFVARPEDEAKMVGTVREFLTAGVQSLKKKYR
jgi:Polyketide cyclase / dehydrase and lipid transport